MKTCTKCNTEYPATTEFFHKDSAAKDKLVARCKKCIAGQGIKYRASKRGKTTRRRYQQTEKSKQYKKEWRKNHPEKWKQQYKKYNATINGCLRTRFAAMKRRCNNPKDRNYKYYGGKGVKVCFASSKEFVDYVVNELQINPKGLQIDRIDNDGHYEPGNIRFVTAKENCQNRRKR